MDLLLEDAVKRRLGARGVAVPDAVVATSVEEAVAAAGRLGCPVVVKALVGVGDRGRKGLVRVAATPEAAGEAAQAMLRTTVEEQVVDRVLVEEEAAAGAEFFVGFGFDYVGAEAVLLHGRGGSGVEEHDGLDRAGFRLSDGPPLEALDEPALRPVVSALFDVFCDVGARSLELNPVRLTGSGPVVLDGKAILDPFTSTPDDAHEVRVVARESTATQDLRRRDAEIGGNSTLRYEELGGDIGLVMWGGGASLVILDALLRLGLRPLNYADVSAGAGILERQGLIADTVLSQRPRGVLMATSAMGTSIVGTAQIFRDALLRQGYDDGVTPTVVRLSGPGEDEARALLDIPNVLFLGEGVGLEDAVEELARLLGHRSVA